jgi:GT2 family glycosyltransferase
MNAIIYLNYNNVNVETLADNIKRAGETTKYVKFIMNEEGIANAINKCLRLLNFDVIDYVTIMGNDIIEPDNWLQIRNDFMQDKTIGICSIPLEGSHTDSSDLIGNFTISKEVILKVGAFNQELDPYGAIDLDYCTRVRVAGFQTKYVNSVQSKHFYQNGLDAYGYNKADSVQKTWQLHTQNVADYQSGTKNYYISL